MPARARVCLCAHASGTALAWPLNSGHASARTGIIVCHESHDACVLMPVPLAGEVLIVTRFPIYGKPGKGGLVLTVDVTAQVQCT